MEQDIITFLAAISSLKKQMEGLQAQIDELEAAAYRLHEKSETQSKRQKNLTLVPISDRDLSEEAMLAYRPNTLPIPNSPQLTSNEILAVRWLCRWRERAIGQPNITSREELIRQLYGLSKGYSTQKYRKELGESLSKRLNRLLVEASR